MKAIIIPVGAMPRTIEVEGLKDMQRAVGGNIELCSWVFNLVSSGRCCSWSTADLDRLA